MVETLPVGAAPHIVQSLATRRTRGFVGLREKLGPALNDLNPTQWGIVTACYSIYGPGAGVELRTPSPSKEAVMHWHGPKGASVILCVDTHGGYTLTAAAADWHLSLAIEPGQIGKDIPFEAAVDEEVVALLERWERGEE